MVWGRGHLKDVLNQTRESIPSKQAGGTGQAATIRDTERSGDGVTLQRAGSNREAGEIKEFK